MKYFECGEFVRIISGSHAGDAGQIITIHEKHAILIMEGTNHELKILLTNLKTKRDEMENIKLQDFIKKRLG